MATLSYYTRPSKADKSALIYLLFNYGRGNRFRKSTGIQLSDVEHWNEKDQKVRSTTKEPMHARHNTFLRNLKNVLLEEYEKCQLRNEAFSNKDAERVLLEFNNTSLREPKKAKQLSLNEYIDKYIQYLPSKRTKKGSLLKAGTIKSHLNALTFFKNYQEIHGIILFKEINEQLYHEVVSHAEKNELSKNYIGKLIARFKEFLNWLKESKEVKLPNYKADKWIVLKEDADTIYLTTNELDKIEEVNLNGYNPYYKRVRDLFIIGAYSGLRVSDYNKLTYKHIFIHEGTKYFRVWSQKTEEEVIIPVHHKVEAILKRNGGLPESVPDQKINEIMKEIGELAGIDNKVIIRKTIGGKLTTKQQPKYELIQNHTGRRSFCTNAYLSGLDTLAIMSVSGHRTEKMFMKYIKVTKQQYAKRIAQHPFFQKPQTKLR